MLPHLAASPCALPPSVRMRRSSCPPGLRETLNYLPLRHTSTLGYSVSNNYTIVPRDEIPTRGSLARPYSVDHGHSAEQAGRLYSWHGHWEGAIPRRQPNVTTEGYTATPSSLRGVAVADGIQNQAPALVSPKGVLDVEYPRSAVPNTYIGRDTGTPATHPLEPLNHPTLPLLGTCHEPPRTHPAGSSYGHPSGNQMDNNGCPTESGSDNDDERSGQDDQDESNGQSDDEHEEDGEGDSGGAGNNTNRRSQPTHGSPLGCPYRKRNRARFNVRDHLACTKPFKNISVLKMHVKKCHTKPPPPSQLGVYGAQHPCQHDHQYQRGDPEDGITSDIDTLLTERKGQLKVCNWEELWATLFPNDTGEIPSSVYEPCIEAETTEITKVVEEAILRVLGSPPAHVAVRNILQRYGYHGTDVGLVASQLVEAFGSVFHDSVRHCLKDWVDRILLESASSSTAAAAPTKTSRTRSSQRGGRVNSGSDRRPPPPGSPAQQLQRLAPRPDTRSPGALSPNAFHDLQHRQQGLQRQVDNAFPSATGNSYQTFTAQTSHGANFLAAPTPVQSALHPESMELLISSWPEDSPALYPNNLQRHPPGAYQTPHPGSTAIHGQQPQRPFSSHSAGSFEAHQQAPATNTLPPGAYQAPHPGSMNIHGQQQQRPVSSHSVSSFEAHQQAPATNGLPRGRYRRSPQY